MNSPLPDASALEAGILEDERHSRLSRVQDNVRNLLRSSVFGSVASSPTTPTSRQQLDQDRPIPTLHSPVRYEVQRGQVLQRPPNSYTAQSRPEMDVARPAAVSRDRAQQPTNESTLFNARAVTALNHPDLSDPSMESLSLQKTRSRQRGRRRAKHRRTAKKVVGSRALLCVLAAVLLAGLVATCKTGLT